MSTNSTGKKLYEKIIYRNCSTDNTIMQVFWGDMRDADYLRPWRWLFLSDVPWMIDIKSDLFVGEPTGLRDLSCKGK